MIRIVDNKKVNMTDSEWELYQNICRAYDRPNFKGEDLFKDLFEVDKNGIILFLKPPSNQGYFSFEIFLFVMSVMVHQHLGSATNMVDGLVREHRAIINEAKSVLEELKVARGESK